MSARPALMSPGEIVAGKYVIDRALDAPGPRMAYAAHIGDRPVRVDVLGFEPQNIPVESEHLIEVIERGPNYLVTELDDGPPSGSHDLEDVVRIARPICAALADLHRAGVVHGALTVQAIALAGDRIKLRDAGLARLDDADPRSLEHVSPEQLGPGPTTPATDIWALATVVFRLLTGQPYFPPERVPRIVDDAIPSATSRGNELGIYIPVEFDEFYARCLTRHAASRFDSIEEAEAALVRTFNRDRINARRQKFLKELSGDPNYGIPQTCLSVARYDTGPHACLSPVREPPQPKVEVMPIVIAVVVGLIVAAIAFVLIIRW